MKACLSFYVHNGSVIITINFTSYYVQRSFNANVNDDDIVLLYMGLLLSVDNNQFI